MGRVRRNDYVLEWFIGDHAPRHVHVYDTKSRFIGRFDLDTKTGHEGWIPEKSC